MQHLNRAPVGGVMVGEGTAMACDAELMRQVQAGCAEAFDVLFARHLPAVRRGLLRMVRDPGVADDLAQEVFLRLWSRSGQWDGRGGVGAWLSRMATNIALNHIRAEGRRRSRTEHWPAPRHDPADQPDELAESAERLEQLRSLIEQLPDGQRRAVELVHQQEMGIAAAADALGIPPGTVKSRVHHARQELMREMRAYEPERQDP